MLVIACLVRYNPTTILLLFNTKGNRKILYSRELANALDECIWWPVISIVGFNGKVMDTRSKSSGFSNIGIIFVIVFIVAGGTNI